MKLTKKDAKLIFQEFVDAKQSQKAKLWDKLVPYGNAYPELYYEIVSHPKHTKKEIEKETRVVKQGTQKLFKLF